MLMKKNNFLLLVMMISFIMFGIISNVSVLAVEFNPCIGFTVSSYSLFSDGAESATWDDLEFGIQTALHVALKVVSLSGAAAATGHNPGITVTIALKGKTYLMMNDSRSGNIICRINGIKTR